MKLQTITGTIALEEFNERLLLALLEGFDVHWGKRVIIN
jgi:hypothetical protein